MSAHRYLADAQSSHAVDAATGVDPGAGGTLDLQGQSGLVFKCTAGDRILPAGYPVGTTAIVTNVNPTAANCVIKDSSDTTIATLAISTAVELFLGTNSSGDEVWLANGLDVSVT